MFGVPISVLGAADGLEIHPSVLSQCPRHPDDRTRPFEHVSRSIHVERRSHGESIAKK